MCMKNVIIAYFLTNSDFLQLCDGESKYGFFALLESKYGFLYSFGGLCVGELHNILAENCYLSERQFLYLSFATKLCNSEHFIQIYR